ncbi:sodium-dependent transporter [Campylobacter pinnipediorum]|uniref:Sodium:alanine symporter n=1 Tax=Campylobacter pinnipediorum subsp. pinnipediorum TaxID=1660067 RepID=A0AAX0L907_9BACT|nr:sodium-dependent transporter [Campylobacter pinnipediorum]AQW82974.1 Na+-dependent transporter, SNF family [Campylobacter pinnipediorum subsp. pinnipediorum]OPA77314.1 sodium:alanine symporter [Campylobacter pinnipediorum subsp. pinnipediorum]
MAKEYFSKLGYVLAVAGSAVGLGSAWKFPYIVGENGGSAFVLLYVFICFLIGVPVFLGELSIGKLSESDSVNSFRKLAPKNKKIWGYFGMLTMITAAIIASYYIVIVGWVLKYIYISFLTLPSDIESSKTLFMDFITTDIYGQIFFFILAFLICIIILSKGVKSGIEKISFWMMPGLFITLLAMLAYSFTMDGFVDSAKFLLIPDFSKITLNSLFLALGLAFFTMSLGMSIIITYSASLSNETNFITSTISIVAINILLAIMMGLIIFTFVFEFGGEPSQGPGLVFISLPTLFSKLGIIGNALAVLFFISLSFAAITSAISLIEPFVFFMIREFKIQRQKALFIVSLAIFIIGVFCILSYIKDVGDSILFFSKNFFDFLDYVASNILSPIGGIGGAIFVGYIIKKEALQTLFAPYATQLVFNIWYFIIKFVAPISILAIMINIIFFN